jgi:chromosome segregation ATPase
MTDAENDLLARILDEVVHGRKAVEDRIDGVAGEVAGLRREMLSHFDAVYARFDRLETEYHALASVVDRLEKRSMSREEFEQKIADLKARVHQLEAKILELEKTS